MLKQKEFLTHLNVNWWSGCELCKCLRDEWRVRLTLMMNAAIFFPLYSTILHWLAAGSVELKAGGESDLKLKHNYTPSLSTYRVSIHVKTWSPVTLISHYAQNINGLLLCFIVNHSIEVLTLSAGPAWCGYKIQNRHQTRPYLNLLWKISTP